MLTPQEQADVRRSVENVQQVVGKQLDSNRNQSFAVTFVSTLQRGVDGVVQAAIDQGVRFDCKAGCSHCCSVRVEALEPEIFQIVRRIRTLPQADIERLTARLKEYAASARGVSALDHRIECAFLKENLCSIYEFRPAVCRKAHSFDVEKCKSRSPAIPARLDIALQSEVLIKGTAKGYRQSKLAASAHNLGLAVLIALTDATAESRWYRGEAVFGDIA